MKRILSEEEKRLWHEVTRHDKALHPQPEGLPEPTPPAVKAVPRPTRLPLAAPKAMPLPELSQGDYANIDRNTAERFRKGQYPLDGRLDLHGMNREKAYRALSGFLAAHYARGSRCLLVITGKGNPGVLRESLPQWLAGDELRPIVLAFDSARPKDGGTGAYYVLLRRKR